MQQSIERIDLSHEEQLAMELWGQLTQETRNLGSELAHGYKKVLEAQAEARQRALDQRPAPPSVPRRNKWTRTRRDTALPSSAPVPTRPPFPTREPGGEDQFGPPPSSPITPPAKDQKHQASLRSDSEPGAMEADDDEELEAHKS